MCGVPESTSAFLRSCDIVHGSQNPLVQAGGERVGTAFVNQRRFLSKARSDAVRGRASWTSCAQPAHWSTLGCDIYGLMGDIM
jgi:hypothetical protein